MKPAETKAIYEACCRAKRIKPQQEEGELWHKALRDLDPRDVRTGLDAWWANTDRDSSGDLKSKWLPAPAELRPLVEQAQRKRERAAAIPTEEVCWECGPCKWRCTGFYPVGSAPLMKCRHCHQPMAERTRRAA